MEQYEHWENVRQIADDLESELTRGLVWNSNCFPSESGYCNGVREALEKIQEILEQKYYLIQKP